MKGDGDGRISFVCPECGKRFKVKAQFAGRRARCVCGSRIQIPNAVPAPAPPAGDMPRDSTARSVATGYDRRRWVGLLIIGAVMLSGLVLVAVRVMGPGLPSGDRGVSVTAPREHVSDDPVDEVVDETPSTPQIEPKAHVLTALQRQIASIAELATDSPSTVITCAQIQRQCERVLAAHPELTQVRNVWEQVRFHKECSQCAGRGTQRCARCNGRGTRRVPDGFTERRHPIFAPVDPKTMDGFECSGETRGARSLEQCSLALFGLYGFPSLSPPPFPDGLAKQLQYLRPSAASLYVCRHCGYYDMPLLVRPFFFNSRDMTEFRAGRLAIRCPRTYQWIGTSGAKIVVRLQQDSGVPGSTNFDFIRPLKVCPNCTRSEYLEKTPKTREVPCEECDGSGSVGICPVCQGSGVERLSTARELPTKVLLENRLATGMIHIDVIGTARMSTILPQAHDRQGWLYLPPGTYRLLVTCRRHQGMRGTAIFAVSEEFAIQHHATYASAPVFVLAPPGQGNLKLTETTRQQLEQMKNPNRGG